MLCLSNDRLSNESSAVVLVQLIIIIIQYVEETKTTELWKGFSAMFSYSLNCLSIANTDVPIKFLPLE